MILWINIILKFLNYINMGVVECGDPYGPICVLYYEYCMSDEINKGGCACIVELGDTCKCPPMIEEDTPSFWPYRISPCWLLSTFDFHEFMALWMCFNAIVFFESFYF